MYLMAWSGRGGGVSKSGFVFIEVGERGGDLTRS